MINRYRTPFFALVIAVLSFPNCIIAAPICEPEKDCLNQKTVSKNVESLKIPPHSAVIIQAYGQCARIENDSSESTLSIPIETPEAWHSFIFKTADQVKVTLCSP